MKKWIILLLIASFCLNVQNSFAQSKSVLFKTNYGNFKVMLYDFTPAHKDLFLQSIQKGTYTNALFNRIVDNFVVQGGEHDDDILAREQKTQKSDGRLAPEFDERAFHKIGALGAGRDNNASKASFFNQIYFVVGKQYSREDLSALMKKYNKQFTAERLQYYLDNGGQPRLDGDYTVFGEVVEGLDVLMKISKVAVDNKNHRPKKKIKFTVSIL